MNTSTEVKCYGVMFDALAVTNDEFAELVKNFKGCWGVHPEIPFLTVVFSTKGKAEEFIKNPIVKQYKVYKHGAVFIPYEDFQTIAERQKEEGREEHD